MKMVSLSEVVALDRKGVHPSEIAPETPYIGLEHIERGGRILPHPQAGDSHLKSLKFSFSAEHILYGKLRPNLGKISRPNFAGICSTDILPLRPNAELDRNYLAHYLSQPAMIRYATSRATGVNLPRLSPTSLAKFPIPLPSLDEQRRIAAILDQADAIRTRRHEQLRMYLALKREVFHAMFFNQNNLKCLGDVADLVSGSTLPAGENFSQQLDGYLLMKVSDMNLPGNGVKVGKTGLWYAGPAPKATTVPAGAVVFPKRGAAIATNKKRLTTRNTVLDPNLMGVLGDNTLVCSEYLLAWLNNFNLSSIASGSSIPQLNKKDLRPVKIHVPPLELQREFSTRTSAIDGQVSRVENALDRDNELYTSLQAQAFKGEL